MQSEEHEQYIKIYTDNGYVCFSKKYYSLEYQKGIIRKQDNKCIMELIKD